jgi:arsenite methyltransferase
LTNIDGIRLDSIASTILDAKEDFMTETKAPDAVREQVRERYAAAAAMVTSGHGQASCCDDSGGCCGPTVVEIDQTFGSALYSARDRDSLPVTAVAASLGCGNPTAVAELREGETVLDLGSGGGIDVLLSAERVGQSGFAYGVDMTDEMLALARANAAKAGATNVEFLKGNIEDIPLPDGSVDVVISNCVINLSVDKPKVLTEMFRVLTPGGRIGISDVVAEDHLSLTERAARGSYVGCIAGALSRADYLDGLAAAGFVDVAVRFTHQAADGMHGAIVQATKPPEDSPAGTATRAVDTDPTTSKPAGNRR